MDELTATPEEFRWIIVKGLLDGYPALREKVKDYLATSQNG